MLEVYRAGLFEGGNLLSYGCRSGAHWVGQNDDSLRRLLETFGRRFSERHIECLKINAFIGEVLVVEVMLDFGHVGDDVGEW